MLSSALSLGSVSATEKIFRFYLTKAELLALTPADFNFEKQTVTISKTFHRSKGRGIITSPKTKKSNRTIKMPPFLCEEIYRHKILSQSRNGARGKTGRCKEDSCA